ncbi:2-amino-4-hydroxy-6-hydroxymethyldihydropteridine diphosphokinase [Pseudomonas sp. B392_1p]|uniref:2-amino-4-hydroxy-6- hydroxymethyldihydropteridine diphosphokinase n=1 Tax=Pseudomonas sp. B392_1p TaxID=3457507 RepID=UPI003FD47A7B
MSVSRVVLGLGSNIQRTEHLHAGLEALSELLGELHCSPVFESLPVGIKSGPFYNLAVSGTTRLPLGELDRKLKFVEADNGRYAPDRKGLPLDIDVLLYDELVGNFHGLILPRAEILKNAFVLWPLALLEPQTRHPSLGKTFAELWSEARIDQQLWPVPFQWRGSELTPVDLLQAYPTPPAP